MRENTLSFAPPKPTICTGLQTLLDVMDTNLHTEAFTVSLRASFVELGLLPRNDGSYVTFAYSKKGYLLALIPQAAGVAAKDGAPTFGDVVTEVEVTNRPDSDDDSDADSDDRSDSGSADGYGISDVDA